MSDGSGAGRPEEIELRIGAELTNLPIIRSLAASIAMRADYDLDAIADLKLAVDEACSTLITRASDGAGLVCVFTVAKDEIRFQVSIKSTSDAAPSSDSFGWRVLTTLTDHADSWVERNGQDGSRPEHLVHIALAKRRADGPA
ncbi:ATP-binding protein [Actinophytocola gossypii]|uniref:ATP-binding protein n=1 Tax=Actinophytocola gossypii TaxID=2812003 RepID=A0ABT2JIM8_9PSEU|nr:ATP-binding protein [Actinophytocola gossypii]MCT2587728.1 ATP-binding protein [Actinophytocola gossypii]